MSRGGDRARDRGQTVYAKPVFAVGGTVSGYGSLGSAESLSVETSSAAYKEKTVWISESKNLPAMTEELQSLSQARTSFKSSFAKELHQENIKSSTWREPDLKSRFAASINSEEISVSDKNDVAEDEYIKVKMENDLLKKKLLDYSKEDEKYKKLQFEIEQLTWQLGKMEQSREVYETATNQLGSFLELVSNRLTIKGGELSPDMKVGKRSQSETRRKSSHVGSHRTSRYLMEDQSLSPSASSSLNTSSCNSESDRNSNRSLRRPSEKTNARSDVVTGQQLSQNQGLHDISILSSCNCEAGEVGLEGDSQRKHSKTKTTLRRLTSFMRKDKSRNQSLLDSSGPTSIKYSSEHFSDPASSVNIVGFRGIWSLRNY